ncbi:hypothetical protein EMCRGX_G014966 [Ephydatia muelleri]
MEVESAIDVSKYSRLGPACKSGKLRSQLGTHNQLSSLHFASLALCFLPSLARAADPEDTRFHKVSQQKVSRMGVAMIGCGVIASFHLDAKMGPVACFSQNITKGVVSYHHIPATLTSGGMMSQRFKALPGQSAHWDPWEVSIPSHHFMATHGPVHQDVDPAPVMVEQTARMMHV